MIAAGHVLIASGLALTGCAPATDSVTPGIKTARTAAPADLAKQNAVSVTADAPATIGSRATSMEDETTETGTEVSTTATDDTAVTASTVEPPEEPSGPTNGAPPIAVRAQQYVAERLSVSPSEIEVVDWAAVEWPTSALGCPETGQMYLQVITPGYRIVLRYAGKRYEVHTDDRPDGAITLCTTTPSE